ncbi:MAG: hypothetical protein WD399_01610 [Thermoleophilaceae bacterium]
MTNGDVVYFGRALQLGLTNTQRDVVFALESAVVGVAPPYVHPNTVRSTLTSDQALELALPHSENPRIELRIYIDQDGRLEILCPALHPGFEVCFNDIWEPRDCAGDLALGVDVVRGLLEGRVEASVLWSADDVAATKDVLVRPDGTRVGLAREFSVTGMLSALVTRRHEKRRVSFMAVDPK